MERRSEETALAESGAVADDPLDLVVRLASGERSALAEVYDRHHAELRSFARRVVGDPDAAEDLVHDVFIALPRAVHRFEGRSTLRTFLFAIAVRQCQHHVRAASARRRARERFAREPIDHAVDPAFRDEQLVGALDRGLDSLPLEQRLALVVCAVEERSSSEASAILGVPEGTVRTRLHRAKQKLREHLEREGFA
jgi:RNA polymerase sigma-70 factor (ECF subfamily)